jgi:hypothetical protein
VSDVQYDIRDIPDPEGGLVLGLYVEGQQVGTARASRDVLDQMKAQLGSDAADVRAILSDALVRHLKQQLEKVELARPTANPAGGLRFVSRYVYRDFDAIYTGVVWYDVPSSTTGPEGLPAVVRNKMRFEVHRLLTEASPNTRGIVDLTK